MIIIIIIAHRAFLAAAVTIYNSGSGKHAASVYMYICILYGIVVRWRRVVVIVRAVEYFMLNPRTAFVKNAPSASRGGANLSVKFEMIERLVSEVTRCVFGLLMWLVFLIMHLIDAMCARLRCEESTTTVRNFENF